MRTLRRWIVGIILISALGTVAYAQFDVGRITGTVLDPTGAVVPGATVTITNIDTGLKTEVQSDSTGNFSAPALPYGNYRLTATATGFGTATIDNVNVHVGAVANLELRLPVGSTKEEVTVTGTLSTVQTSTSEVGNTLTTSQVENLPLNGRDIMGYIALVPGSITTAGMFQQSLNGQETGFTGLNTLLDGADATRIDTNATSTTFGAQNSRIGRASVDSIAEVHIVTTGYSAEYGRASGAVVNLITKSGTNDLHGAVFEFFRNDAINARNFFEYTEHRQPFKLNQFGGNLEGPIVKNKLFFFVNYEGVRQQITNSFLSSTLSAAERAKFVPSMQPYVSVLPPLPANPIYLDPPANTLVLYSASLLDKLREDTGSIKIDHQISDKDRWNLRYNVNDSFTAHPFNINRDQIQKVPARSQYVRFDETHIFSPTLLNEIGFAVNRQFTNGLSGEDNLPLFSNFANVGAAPGPALFSELTPKTTFQFLESLTKTAGKHSLKFGADIRRQQINNMLRQQDILTFLSLDGLENNQPFALSRLGYPTLGFRSTNWDFYAQDDWKVTPRFTLNLGLRYEYNTVFHVTGQAGVNPVWSRINGYPTVTDRVSNFDFATQTLFPVGRSFYEPDYNNFAPRVGFSYDPFGKGKTVIRGFGGISYLPMLQGAVNSLPSNNFPNLSLTVFDFPLTFPVPAELPAIATLNVNTFDPHARDSYTEQWELNIQHEILPQTVLTVGYVGNHGVKLPAGAAFAGLQLNNVDIFTGLRPYPKYGDERLLGNFLGSNYNSLQVGVRRRAARFTFDANYTWGHEIDNTVNIFGAFENSRNINLDHGNGDIDVRHNFTADALYDLPALHSQAAVVRGVLGDWHAATILQARSGLPFTIGLQPGVFAADPQRPNWIPGQSITPPNYSIPDRQLNPAAFSFTGPVGAVGGTLARNSMTGPTFVQWDISMQKRFAFTEKLNLEFRSDFFNILNHPNFNNPDSTLCTSYATSSPANTCVPNPLFGRSTSTLGNLVGLGTSRQIQFALKLLW